MSCGRRGASTSLGRGKGLPPGPRRDELRVVSRTRLQPAREAGPVDGDEAEMLAIALRPFEIVEQRPVDVAEHVDPLIEAAFDLGDAGTDPGYAAAVGVRSDRALGDEDRLLRPPRREPHRAAERGRVIF